jgi:hypothetical protein
MEPILKNCKERFLKNEQGRGIRKSNKGGEYYQCKLYACMEI